MEFADNILTLEGLLKLLIMSSAFLAVFVLVLKLLPNTEQRILRRRLGVAEDQQRPNRIFMVRMLRPLIHFVLPYVSKPSAFDSEGDAAKKILHRKLISANVREDLSPDEFKALKWVTAVIVPFMAAYLTGTLGRPLPIVLWPVAIYAGYIFPDLWLSQMVAHRRRQIVRALPYTLDLLTLSVEAGLDFMAAISRLVQRGKTNALLSEFNQMLKEIRLGTSRSDSLRNLSERLQIEEISSFTTLLIQADQLGASIGNVLRAQSDQLRAHRFQAAEAAGAKASQLILFPLVTCIFPSIFILFIGLTAMSAFRMGIF